MSDDEWTLVAPYLTLLAEDVGQREHSLREAFNDDVRFPKPLFYGDTIRVETEVIDLRESRSRPNAGIVTYVHRTFNQSGELVAQCKRSRLHLKRPAT